MNRDNKIIPVGGYSFANARETRTCGCILQHKDGRTVLSPERLEGYTPVKQSKDHMDAYERNDAQSYLLYTSAFRGDIK